MGGVVFPFLSIWKLWERFGGFGERPGGFREHQEAFGENLFFYNFLKIFIFEVFGHSVIEFVMKLDENFCPCGHVESWNRA